jgi:predicted dehydrogenase
MTITAFDPADQYEIEVSSFSKAVRGDLTSYCGSDDAIANMRDLDAVFESLHTGNWVNI